MPIGWRGPTALLVIGALSLLSGGTSAGATAHHPPSAGGGAPPGATPGDPVLAADAACDFYLTFIAADDFSASDPLDPTTWVITDGFIAVSKSTDGGQTFGTPR